MTNIHPDMTDGDRLLELLAEEQTLGLDEERRLELEELVCGATSAGQEREAFERAAAAAMVAMTEEEACPSDVMAALQASVDRYVGREGGLAENPSPSMEVNPTTAEAELNKRRNLAFHYAGWFAAAACFVLAVVAWWPTPGAMPAAGPENRLAQVKEAIEAAPDPVTLEWAQWDTQLGLEGEAEVPGVKGEIVWSDSANTGYMVFEGLPELEGAEYQLWIVDSTRGLDQRVSGGVFTGSPAGGRVEVPIEETPVPINEAAAFAVTIEKPGGTWVSDMSRRVVITTRG